MKATPPEPSPAAVVIAGPTASGKTTLAIEVAERLGTEIISADSMQFYRGMEIGTAAPTAEQRARVRHHFVGFLNPNEDFSAGAFEVAAREVVRELNSRGLPAVVVGGSGLYIRALVETLFSGPGKDEGIRNRLKEEAEREGKAALYARLREVDPDYAGVIHPGDLRRVVRALEVFEVAGRPLSELHRAHQERREGLDAAVFGLDLDRACLYERIEARVDAMVRAGLIDEVRTLISAGYGDDIERLRTLGHREMAAHLRGETTLDEAIDLIKRNTRRYAKRQLSWFRGEPGLRWLKVEPEAPMAAMADEIIRLMRRDDR